MHLIRTEALYHRLPTWMQNAALSVYGIAWRNERLGGAFDATAREFRDHETWSPAAFEAYQIAQLRRVLVEAWDLVPYYREKWNAAGIRRGDLQIFSLKELPLIPATPKDDLRRDPDAFVVTPLRGNRRLRRYRTSGSTGTPIVSIYTPEGHRRFIAAREARSFNWADVSLRMPRAMVGGRMIIPHGSGAPYYRYNRAERQVYFSAFHIGPATAGSYVEGFNRFRPPVLTGYAHSYYVLARLMAEQQLSLCYRPAALILSSEKISPDMRRLMEQTFKVRVFEEYGSVENCVLATECKDGHLHVSPDFGILEIVNDEGNPVPVGSEGRILGTAFLNEAQHLIRFDLGDRGIWSSQTCSCGRNHLPILQEVVGRAQDVVITPAGKEVQMLQAVFASLPNIVEAQIVQEKLDFIRVRVVASTELGQTERRVIEKKLIERLGQIRIEIEQIPALERTERGKFRPVVSKLTGQDIQKARDAATARVRIAGSV